MVVSEGILRQTAAIADHVRVGTVRTELRSGFGMPRPSFELRVLRRARGVLSVVREDRADRTPEHATLAREVGSGRRW